MEDVLASMMSIFFGLIFLLPVMADSIPNNKDSALREAMQKQDWDAAVNKIQALQENAANEANKDLYSLVEAIVLQRKGKLDESIKLLEPIKETSLYFSWAKLILARLSYQSGNIELLKKNLKAIEKAPLKGDLKVEKNFYDAYLLIESKKWAQAAKVLRQIERPSSRTDFHIPILENLALAQIKSQSMAIACTSVTKLYINHPDHPWFKDVAPEIRNINLGGKVLDCAVTPKEFDQRRRSLNIRGDIKKASEELAKWFSITKLGEKEQKILQAQQSMAEGHVDEGLQMLKNAKSGPNDIQVLIPLSYAAAKAGDLKLAVECSLAIHKALPKNKKGTMAFYQAGVWAYQMRDYENAELRLRSVYSNNLSRNMRKEIQWYLAWIQYLKGNYVAAEKSFQAMLKNEKESSDRVRYWMGMTYFRMNQLEKARPIFQKLTAKSGLNYYSGLATERLKQIHLRSPASEKSVSSSVAQVSVAGRAPYFTPYIEAAPLPTTQDGIKSLGLLQMSGGEPSVSTVEEENTIDEDEKVSDNVDLFNQDLFTQTEANQKLERAKAFWMLGLEDLARREVGDLERFSRNFDLFKRIVEEYRMMGLYNKMTVLGHNFIGRANLNSNRIVYESIYPKAYSEYVEKYGEENNVSPAMIWGIMKAESMYQPWVKSSVGALGLMQVMPTTGQKIAGMLNVKSFAPEMLLEPAHAIRFGSKYLERLGKKFDYSVQLMAAAYNAGPHRVSQWLYHFGYMQMDEWVEHIPFVETRNYVKKVTMNYIAYNELYGRNLGDSINLTDAVPVQVAGNPESKENWE
jgi:soluble lytic murein transglycosylase